MTRRSESAMEAGRAWSLATARCVSVLLGVGVVLLPMAVARAGEPTDQLKGSIDQVIRMLEDPALKSDAKAKERSASIRKVADTIFDFGETARRALGPHWRSLSEQDRQEFVSLFADLLQRSYVAKIERYSGEKITYAGDSVDGELATVKTRFLTKDGTEIPVDYRMLRRGDRWLVYDVVVEGVSLVNNYRTQFNRIIQTGSYQELVAKMKSSAISAPGGSTGKNQTPRS